MESTPEKGFRMTMLAGPNGSGKSTVTRGLQKEGVFPKNYVNADDIALTLGEITDVARRNLIAATKAEEQRQNLLSLRQTFAFETVMSTPSKIGLIYEAQARGYQVDLVFVSTKDFKINQARVLIRVGMGGTRSRPRRSSCGTSERCCCFRAHSSGRIPRVSGTTASTRHPRP